MLWPSGCQTWGVFLVCQSLHEIGEVLPGELPLEGLGGFLVAPLKGEESLLDLCEVHEVVGGQHLALDDRVDLDLVQPGGMDRAMDQAKPPAAVVIGVATFEPLDRGSSSHVSRQTRAWLAERERFRVHLTPSHASRAGRRGRSDFISGCCRP